MGGRWSRPTLTFITTLPDRTTDVTRLAPIFALEYLQNGRRKTAAEKSSAQKESTRKASGAVTSQQSQAIPSSAEHFSCAAGTSAATTSQESRATASRAEHVPCLGGTAAATSQESQRISSRAEPVSCVGGESGLVSKSETRRQARLDIGKEALNQLWGWLEVGRNTKDASEVETDSGELPEERVETERSTVEREETTTSVDQRQKDKEELREWREKAQTMLLLGGLPVQDFSSMADETHKTSVAYVLSDLSQLSKEKYGRSGLQTVSLRVEEDIQDLRLLNSFREVGSEPLSIADYFTGRILIPRGDLYQALVDRAGAAMISNHMNQCPEDFGIDSSMVRPGRRQDEDNASEEVVCDANEWSSSEDEEVPDLPWSLRDR